MSFRTGSYIEAKFGGTCWIGGGPNTPTVEFVGVIGATVAGRAERVGSASCVNDSSQLSELHLLHWLRFSVAWF